MTKARRAGRKRRPNGKHAYAASQVTLAPNPWDEGTRPPAREAFAVVEDRGEIDPDTGKRINPNGVKGIRYKDMLEIYRDRGWISAAGYEAALKVRVAWLNTEKGQCPPWLRERVDSSPKPDTAIAVQIDRLSRMIRLGSVIPAEDSRIVHHVACLGSAIGGLPEYRGMHHEKGKKHLMAAMDRLADNISRVA